MTGAHLFLHSNFNEVVGTSLHHLEVKWNNTSCDILNVVS